MATAAARSVVPTPPSTASWKGNPQPTRRVNRVPTVSNSRRHAELGLLEECRFRSGVVYLRYNLSGPKA